MKNPPSSPSGAGGPDPGVGNRRADPRLPAYIVAGFLGLLAAVATGRPELAALGAPFLALATAGLVSRRDVAPTGRVTLQGDRVIEGDVVDGEIRIDWDGDAEVDVVLAGLRGVTPLEPAPVVGWALPAGPGPITLPFQFRARSWGVHSLGSVWVRIRTPGSLIVDEQALAVAPTLRVLPSPLRLDRLLRPAEPRAVSGVHVSRLRGAGTDFAELRPYQPGDRLRDLSWGTSARLGSPWVIVHHPERTGTVLLFLDAFPGIGGEGSTTGLARAARAVWAVVSLHLRVQDRVGLLAQGRTAAWVPPGDGRRARWMILEALLNVGGAGEDLLRRRRHQSRRVVVPADALVVGVTGLRSRGIVPDLLHQRRAGHTTVALVIDTSDLLPDPVDSLDAAARRIWFAQRDGERDALHRGGVPTALVTPDGGVGPAISALRRATRGTRATRETRSAREIRTPRTAGAGGTSR